MVEILFCLIRASREGNLMPHLALIKAVIPWMFAYDRLHYAIYPSVYYKQCDILTSVDSNEPL